MLGIYGQIKYDKNEEQADRLMSLGFFRDECSMTRNLYYDGSVEDVVTAEKPDHETSVGIWDLEVFGFVIIAYCIVSTTIICYYCIKNRKKICSRKRQPNLNSSDVREGEIEVNSLD